MSSGFRLAARLKSYPYSPVRPARQMPDKSGLPSAVRGAGAERFGLPSGKRGTPGVGWLIHCCAIAGADNAHTSSAAAIPMSRAFIVSLRLMASIEVIYTRNDAEGSKNRDGRTANPEIMRRKIAAVFRRCLYADTLSRRHSAGPRYQGTL